nr:serine/threonine/dual specificity protein kinase, catalytic domain-containing protein [Tanacetum cinerariifolium]GEY66949.1 serine/threonine/dual specificity protein kinase, catalytic domain-containing protein [Tanacetum cinerariifolium]
MLSSFSLVEIKLATHDFDDALVIGKVWFGKVYKDSSTREMILVYEYMPNESLHHYLHKRKANGRNSSPLTWVQRPNICIGSTCALDYLYTGTGFESKVIHHDVKSSNVLLDEKLAAKIFDFGVSKIGPANQLGTTNVYTGLIRGTFGYIDVEYLSTNRLIRKSDVYAFGVVLLETLCGRLALNFTLDEQQHSLADGPNTALKKVKYVKLLILV